MVDFAPSSHIVTRKFEFTVYHTEISTPTATFFEVFQFSLEKRHRDQRGEDANQTHPTGFRIPRTGRGPVPIDSLSQLFSTRAERQQGHAEASTLPATAPHHDHHVTTSPSNSSSHLHNSQRTSSRFTSNVDVDCPRQRAARLHSQPRSSLAEGPLTTTEGGEGELDLQQSLPVQVMMKMHPPTVLHALRASSRQRCIVTTPDWTRSHSNTWACCVTWSHLPRTQRDHTFQ